MDTTHHTDGRSRTVRLAAAFVAALLALTTGLVATASAPPSGAAEDPPAGLTWKVSENTWNSSSLSPARTTAAPATIDGDQLRFPEATDVSVDAFTGAVAASFPGSFTIGNLVQGNYRIRFADLQLTIPAGRATGTVTADVSYGIAQTGQEPTLGTPTRVPLANLTFAPGSIVDTGSNISFTVTPDFVVRTDEPAATNGWKTFPQPLIDLLQTSTPPLGGHFRQTAAGQDAKAPSPLHVSLAYVPSDPPAGLTWRVSQQAWTSSSLSPAHGTDAPATKTEQGFSFPQASSAIYDPETGMGQIDFPGALVLGNLVQGNYRIKLANPSIELPGDGTGALVADVSWGIAPTGQEPTYNTPTRLSVADLTLPEEAITVDGDQLSFLVTPDFVLRTDEPAATNGWRTFPQPFVDLLQTATPPLGGHFRQTADDQGAKAPAPLGVTVTFAEPDPDELLVEALYTGILARGAGEGELAYWVGRLDGSTTAEAVVNAIVRSTEGRRRLVRLGYLGALDRDPSTAEVDYWAGRLASGLTPELLLVQLLASPEALTTWGGTGDDLAEGAYEVFLHHAGDPGGIAYWGDRLDAATGTSGRGAVLKAFGRTAAATRAAIRAAFTDGCHTLPTQEPDETALFASIWSQSGHNPLTMIGAAIVTVCPEGSREA